MEYVLHLTILICFYTSLSQSLNLTAGKTGMISLAQAGFYGIGAYSTALLSLNFNLAFWITMPIAILICGLATLLISIAALRTVEDYFIICTIGIQIIIFSLMNNLTELTKGPLGLSGIPPIAFLGFSFSSKLSFLLLAIFFMAITWMLLSNLSASGFGRTLVAISEDEIYAQSLGKDVTRSKTIAFTLSAMLAAIPGVLYAHYISYIAPTGFTINESIFILSIIIIGGAGNLKGSFLASIFMILLPEILRFVGMPDSIAPNMRQIIYGLLLTILMLTGKNGIGELFKKNS